jgi:hypothetical protein
MREGGRANGVPPTGVTLRRRWLLVSATMVLPLGSTASRCGALKRALNPDPSAYEKIPSPATVDTTALHSTPAHILQPCTHTNHHNMNNTARITQNATNTPRLQPLIERPTKPPSTPQPLHTQSTHRREPTAASCQQQAYTGTSPATTKT